MRFPAIKFQFFGVFLKYIDKLKFTTILFMCYNKNKGGNSMKLLFKQRFFSWLDSYDVYDEAGNTVYTVKGQLSWGHCLKIFDQYGREVGMVKERILTFMPKFEIYIRGEYIGCIHREFSFLRPRYHIDCNGWQVEGNFWEVVRDVRLPWDRCVCASAPPGQ